MNFNDISSTRTSFLRNLGTLKEVVKCELSNGGGNYFQIPYVKKVQRMRVGEDITEVRCTREIIDQAESILAAPDPSEDDFTL